jgi:hypothetical protein
MPHRCTVAIAKSRAAGTAVVSVPGVRMATRGKHVHRQGAGSGASGQLPLAKAAVSTADSSQRHPPPLPALPAGHGDETKGAAIIAFW